MLYVSHCGELGGAERSLVELMEAVQPLGIDPLLACPDGGGLAKAAAGLGIRVIEMPLRTLRRSSGTWARAADAAGAIRLWPRFARLLRNEGVALVHANSATAMAYVGPAAKWNGVPCVWHWRDFLESPRLCRMLGTRAACSIAISRAIRDCAAAQLPNGARLVLIRNGVKDMARSDSRSRLRTQWGAADGDIVVGMLAQAIPRKGHEVLIRALADARDQCPALRVVFHLLVLDDAHRSCIDSLERLADDLGCRERVTFAGPAEDAAASIDALDIVAVPSLREPFGRAAVEAMLGERPVAASNIDGLSEIVADGVTGLLFPPGDHRALAEVLVRLAADADLRRRMGRAGRQRALAEFSVTRAAAEVVRLYRELVRSEA